MRIVLLVVPLFLVVVAAPLRASQSLNVAVASNFLPTARKLGVEFEAMTGVRVRFSGASTGLLYAQIVNGAPFDVFLAADEERPRILQQGGYALANNTFSYARGRLVLWSNEPSFAQQDCYRALQEGRYRRLAIANPRTAPYGMAAKRFLQAHDLWDSAQGRTVFGENVAQTYQFVSSGNVTLALLAASQVMTGEAARATCHVALKATEVRQSGLVLRSSKDPFSAQAFADFLSSPTARRILEHAGYTFDIASEASYP